MGKNVKFWDKIAKRYAKQPIADQASYEKKLAITQSYLKTEMEVLEIGCGTGSTAILHAPYVKHYRATDLSEKMLEIANNKPEAKALTNLSFEKTSIDNLPVVDNALDGVLALSVLHLLEDRDVAISKVYRMLKPGGFFFSSTVCLQDGYGWLKCVVPIGRLFGLMPLVRFFTRDDLEESLKQAGFEIVEVFQPGNKKSVFVVAKKPSS